MPHTMTATTAAANPLRPETQKLSEALREHTARAHEAAEQSTFIHELMRGQLDCTAFIRLQEQSWLFYSALEAAVGACTGDPRSRPLLDRRLDREPALAQDLDHLHGHHSWREQIHPTAATAAYIAELEEIAATRDFPRLLAHHYVRYLGDLSGGQVIARMVGDHYGVPAEALSFYRFADLGKLKPYKDNYRTALDTLDLTEVEREILLQQAHQAFLHNQQVFHSLG